MTVHIGSSSFVGEGVYLHGDSDADGSDELFGLPLAPMKASGSAALVFLDDCP